MFFCYFFSLTGRQTVAFSLLIYSNASNGRNRIYFALWKQRPGAIIPLRWGGEAVSPLTAPLDKSQWKKIFNASETGIMSAWWLMSNPFMHLHFSKKGGGGGKPPSSCSVLGRWDVLFLSTNLLPRSSSAGFLLPLSDSSKSPEPVIRGRAHRPSKHIPALAKTSPKVSRDSELRFSHSASLGFSFSGMAASILEVGNVIVSISLFFYFVTSSLYFQWQKCF